MKNIPLEKLLKERREEQLKKITYGLLICGITVFLIAMLWIYIFILLPARDLLLFLE